jgi:chromosome partitioning protein
MDNCEVIAIVNQKGGVGKTTTCANLGIGLALKGKRVLLIDGDPQASLTISLGQPQPDELPITLTDILNKILVKSPLKPKEGILRHIRKMLTSCLPALCCLAWTCSLSM